MIQPQVDVSQHDVQRLFICLAKLIFSGFTLNRGQVFQNHGYFYRHPLFFVSEAKPYQELVKHFLRVNWVVEDLEVGHLLITFNHLFNANFLFLKVIHLNIGHLPDGPSYELKIALIEIGLIVLERKSIWVVKFILFMLKRLFGCLKVDFRLLPFVFIYWLSNQIPKIGWWF